MHKSAGLPPSRQGQIECNGASVYLVSCLSVPELLLFSLIVFFLAFQSKRGRAAPQTRRHTSPQLAAFDRLWLFLGPWSSILLSEPSGPSPFCHSGPNAARFFCKISQKYLANLTTEFHYSLNHVLIMVIHLWRLSDDTTSPPPLLLNGSMHTKQTTNQ